MTRIDRRNIDGHQLRALIAAGGRALDVNREQINALNVFPVPDGDTGTNMCLTIQAIVADADANPSASAGETARRMARSALLAARGNSGLIAAQLFKGIAVAAEDARRMGPAQFANGLTLGAQIAYSAVPDPREGTMLTVMREAAESATGEAGRGADFRETWRAAAVAAEESVARTPTLLSVLRDAGVVDSGGYGVSVLFHGALELLDGRGDGATEMPPPAAFGISGDGAVLATSVREGFVAASREKIYGYCTVFVIEGQGLDPDAIRTRVTGFGESCVVAGDDSAAKIHVHPLDPGPVLSYGASLGTLAGITILNMDEQTRDWAAGQSGPAKTEVFETAVVAVVAGEGLSRLFVESGLEACSTVAGGDGMNPSVQELLAAVEQAPAPSVILLPNNKNVTPAAREVPALTEKEVHVLPTRSIQAGIAAVLAFSHRVSANDNAAAMEEAAAGLRAGAVCRAVRDATVSDRAVREGDMMALVDDELVAVASDSTAALVQMAEAAGGASELVTIYYGADVTGGEAHAAASAVRKALPEAEVEVVPGGQPHYDYLVSLE
ncbi:MAG: DAK2 domain-containing protein [Dehalococcoidia bacterium]